MFTRKITVECRREIEELARKGMSYRAIHRELKKKYPELKYDTTRYHAHKIYTPREKRVIELNFIESSTALCQEMTSWVRRLREEYESHEEVSDKSKFAYHLNKAFENFVNLLKTPAIQTTQVNILQQQLEQSLGDLIHERTSAPVKISS